MTTSPPPCQTPNPPDPPPDIPDGTLIRRSESIDNEDSDEASTRGKKQKTLSSLADTSASAKSKKKSKKKNNNVWTKPTSRKGKKKSKASAQTNPSAPPDTVLITPIPRFPDKSDDSPGATICLSRAYKAEKVELSEDRMTAGSTKGYRMVRATRGVSEGAWYFEVKVVRLGETGHTRLGWTMDKGDLQAPVGYDGNSYGYRDVDGSKVHKALREKYGEEGYFEGDVIGFYINLPEGHLYEPKPPHLVWYKGQRYMYPADGKDDPPKVVPGSEISFFKNGICQGVAYADLIGGRYYPAASMYTLPNQPNCEVRFNFGPDFEFFPQDFGSRPIPRPMVEVPYHGYDCRAEGATSNGLSENATVATNGLPDRTVSANGPSVEMIASVNYAAEDAAVTADCKVEETTEIANILAEEATALTNGLVVGATVSANGPVEEMVLYANGLTNAVSANGPSVEMIASVNNAAEDAAVTADCKVEETTEIANILAEKATALTNGLVVGATVSANGPVEERVLYANGLTNAVSANGPSVEMIASVNNAAEDAAVTADCKVEETTEIANILAEEATALTNGLVVGATVSANGPVEEMVLYANGLTNE